MVFKVSGVVFSDLGRASQFMALDWVQQELRRSLGYNPFPATLNLRPATEADALMWRAAQKELKGIEMAPARAAFCSARIFLVDISRPEGEAKPLRGAVLLPEIADYPGDKIEVVAPERLKDKLGVADGDRLTLEFIH